jgi:hypothetical protein
MAIEDPTAFKAVIARAKEALEADVSAAKAVPAGASVK